MSGRPIPGGPFTGAKRSSPPAPVANNNMKRAKSGEYLSNDMSSSNSHGPSGPPVSGGGGGGGGGGSNVHAIDPDQLSDALHSAGVNLKEEEHLLSRSLHQPEGLARASSTAVLNQNARLMNQPFLEVKTLHNIVRKSTSEMGIRHISDKDNEIVSLISVSCQEWLSDILTSAVILSRHRRRSRTETRSDISKALRNIAIKDKENEDRRSARKAALGLDSEGGDKAGSEDTQHRAANATALMMTSGKKKYSWLTGGTGASSPAPRQTGPTLARQDNSVRYREVREEPGLVLRDLLAALEQRRIGVEKAIIKGYAKVKN